MRITVSVPKTWRRRAVRKMESPGRCRSSAGARSSIQTKMREHPAATSFRQVLRTRTPLWTKRAGTSWERKTPASASDRGEVCSSGKKRSSFRSKPLPGGQSPIPAERQPVPQMRAAALNSASSARSFRSSVISPRASASSRHRMTPALGPRHQPGPHPSATGTIKRSGVAIVLGPALAIVARLITTTVPRSNRPSNLLQSLSRPHFDQNGLAMNSG